MNCRQLELLQWVHCFGALPFILVEIQEMHLLRHQQHYEMLQSMQEQRQNGLQGRQNSS